MASLLERMNIPTNSLGPVRSKQSNRGASAPYNRANRAPRGDVDSQWSHDLFESHNSLSARLNVTPTAPKANLNPIAQKAIRDATTGSRTDSLSIKGAGSMGNVVEVTGLVGGTTAEDVAAIFKRCGQITDQKSMSNNRNDPRIRITFKTAASATSAVQKFNNQPADGKILSVKIVGASATGTSLGGRLGGSDGLDIVRDEGSVDVLMNTGEDTGSKMRSDSLLNSDPRAQVLLAPPGADPADYTQTPETRGGGRRGGRGRGGARSGRGRKRGGNNGGRMEVD
uniref:RRM domain-containing protein n=1 Tax=Psilocybe cubensis TaxID=181762 RepID=A0A8H7Y8K6_PSICU